MLPTGNALGQQITGAGITNPTYITGYGTGTGSWTPGNPTYNIRNNASIKFAYNFRGGKFFQVVK